MRDKTNYGRLGGFFMPVYNDEIRKKEWIKTIRKLVLAIILWAVAITRIVVYGAREDAKETLVGAFNQIQLEEMEAGIESFGYYGDIYMSCEAREAFVKNIGYALGINYCDVTESRDGNICTTEIFKEGKYAHTSIKLITKEEKLSENVIQSHQYVSVNINLGTNIGAAMDYQKVLKEVFDKYDIDGDVTVNLSGNLSGKADIALKNLIVDQLIEEMDAKIVAQSRTDELFTIYAYTKNVDGCIKVSGKKINLNISSYYDETKDATQFYVSTPMVSADY